MVRIWTDNTGTDFHIYWYIGIGLFVLLIPMAMVRDISKFNKLHIIGDIAVISVVLTLAITSITLLVTGASHGTHVDMVTENWPITLGMSITMLEGVGLVLPIKVLFI
jgi:hypothetical protein